jgi:hypothetical protein
LSLGLDLKARQRNSVCQVGTHETPRGGKNHQERSANQRSTQAAHRRALPAAHRADENALVGTHERPRRSNRGLDEWLAILDDPMCARSAIGRFNTSVYDLVIEGEP